MSSRDPSLGALLDEGLPTVAQLEYMAFQGHAERVHVIFKRIPRADRALYASRHVLGQVVRGGIAAIRSTPREAVSVIAEEREFLTEVVSLFVAHCRQEAVFPRELFVALARLVAPAR